MTTTDITITIVIDADMVDQLYHPDADPDDTDLYHGREVQSDVALALERYEEHIRRAAEADFAGRATVLVDASEIGRGESTSGDSIAEDGDGVRDADDWSRQQHLDMWLQDAKEAAWMACLG